MCSSTDREYVKDRRCSNLNSIDLKYAIGPIETVYTHIYMHMTHNWQSVQFMLRNSPFKEMRNKVVQVFTSNVERRK